MSDFLWALAVIPVCVLLMYSAYVSVVGLTGVITGAAYLRCGRCHHHYLRVRKGGQHDCPHGILEDAYQVGWRSLHHSHSKGEDY
jgi:hypothetical protein